MAVVYEQNALTDSVECYANLSIVLMLLSNQCHFDSARVLVLKIACKKGDDAHRTLCELWTVYVWVWRQTKTISIWNEMKKQRNKGLHNEINHCN